MAINKYMQAALKALSNVDVDIKTNYRLIRQLERAARKPRIKLTYQTRDYHIKNGNENIPIRIFFPTNSNIERSEIAKFPVIVFFHGGGWVTGDLDSYEKPCLSIARQTGHILVAVDYRLAPENPFPAALEDCYQAVKVVMRWHKASGSPHKLTLMGDSAGGNLAAALSLYMRDRGEKIADRQILIYPATYNDHTGSSPFPSVAENGTGYILTAKNICDYMDLYCGKTEDRLNPYLAPLLADDFSNQPDTLIITAQHDPLRDEGEEYGRKLQEWGNSVTIRRIDNALHGYFSLPVRFRAVRQSFELINQFLKGDNCSS
jgi:acetyl esterase/lipase